MLLLICVGTSELFVRLVVVCHYHVLWSLIFLECESSSISIDNFKISGALCGCLLPETLQVSTVKQLPEYHDCSGEQSLFEYFISMILFDSASTPYIIQLFPLLVTFANFFLFLLLLSEEDGTESISTTTARESTEIDDDHEKSLLSPLAVSGDVAFVKEVQKWYWTGEENRRLLQHHCLDLLHFYFFFPFFFLIQPLLSLMLISIVYEVEYRLL